MECFVGFVYTPPTLFSRPISIYHNSSKRTITKTGGRLRAKLDDQNDPLLQAALDAASLRLQETFRPGCFVPYQIDVDTKQCSLHYYLATKFIDDKLLRKVNQMDGLKQVVLLMDGLIGLVGQPQLLYLMYPHTGYSKPHTIADAGAKIPKGCLFRHIPLESSNVQQILRAKGFNGNLPSIWAMQGLPVMTLSSFEEILLLVSGWATNGYFFLGELPARLAETDVGIKYSAREWMEKVFMSNGFHVNMISHDKVARSLGKSITPENYNNILFLAEQLRFSDDQMETWRKEFQRVEEEGAEEGFGEL